MKFNNDPDSVKQAASKIELLLLDVDGVLTDGKLFFSNSGEEIKAFHSLDGHGIKMLKKAGIEVGLITGRRSVLLEKRAADLGIDILLQGREDKIVALEEIRAQLQLENENICYAGDDFPDLPALRAVGLSFSVPNGHCDIVSEVDAITETAGGMGAAREITDYILKAQDKYAAFLQP